MDDPDPVVRRTMLRLLIIPLGLLVLTIAFAPILTTMLLRDAERVPESTRLPWGMGRSDDAASTDDTPVPDAAVRDGDGALPADVGPMSVGVAATGGGRQTRRRTRSDPQAPSSVNSPDSRAPHHRSKGGRPPSAGSSKTSWMASQPPLTTWGAQPR